MSSTHSVSLCAQVQRPRLNQNKDTQFRNSSCCIDSCKQTHAKIATRINLVQAGLPVQELRSEVLLELFIDQGLDAVVAAVLL